MFFCNRGNETKLIYKRIKKNSNTFLISPDGIGKTSLINHVLDQLKVENKFKTVMIDLIFYTTFKKFLVSYIEILSSLISPKKNQDELEHKGELQHLSEVDLLKKLNQVFGAINGEKKKVIIVFDNIQHSYHYGSEIFENSILNPIIHAENVFYILSGTKKIYTLEKTEDLYLEIIDRNEYQNFVLGFLSQKDIRLSKKALSVVVEWSGGEVSLMSAIFTRVLEFDTNKIKVKEIRAIIDQLMFEVTGEFKIVKDLLSPYQWKLLIVIALQDGHYQITSSSFIANHELNAPSSVKTALDALSEKELIYKYDRKYELTNRLLKNWIMYYSKINNRILDS